jgi:hypothetical protein
VYIYAPFLRFYYAYAPFARFFAKQKAPMRVLFVLAGEVL